MDEREKFISKWQEHDGSFAELCREWGISRKTGYKWLERFNARGQQGLAALSRAPHHSPQQMTAAVQSAILELRKKHTRWGPRKLRKILRDQEPAQHWPVLSTIGDLLRREGLSHPLRKRQRTPPYQTPLQHAQAPNQVWCADYKGWFRCQDGSRCDPFTVTDAFSRYLLRCRTVDRTDEKHTRAVMEAVFQEYGLPEAIRTDNGSPFASSAPGGLSRLSVWWTHLGIRHERIVPGHPEQNGRHERMHQTLKQETASPPQPNLQRQQAAFRAFEQEYNQVRPHEALDYRTPSQCYVGSSRAYPARLPEIEYPAHYIRRRISSAGELTWKHQDAYCSRVLAGEAVGLKEVEDSLYEVYFGPLLLGWFDSCEIAFVVDRVPCWHTPPQSSEELSRNELA